MQLHLDDIALFTRIAELGSLSAAARERNVPVSQVTRSLARLEAAVKVRLLHRSTHGLSLTDEGDIFLNYGRQLLATKDELAGELTGKRSESSGWVRISVSPALNRWTMADGQGQKELLVKGHTRADSTALLLNLVLHGVGISRINDLFALPLMREGRLVPLLQTQFVSPRVPIYAVMLQERQPKIRACIDYWTQWLAQMTQAVAR